VSQLYGRPHLLLIPAHGLLGLQLLFMLGYVTGLISQRKSPGVRIQGLAGCD
jgi:hypothetical protein